MFFYNKDGYLRPYKAIETNLETFRKEFAWNEHRQMLFDKYLEFNENLKALQPGPYFQWVDGSYVSKKELPGDIDFVTFVDFERYKLLKSRLWHLGKSYGDWLDMSFAVNYPEKHPFHNVTLILKDEYHHLYGSTRQHIGSKIGRPKGYLQLNFG